MELTMSIQDRVALTGRLSISLNGKVVQEVNNLVVTAGKSWIASRMNAATASVMTHMGVGTNSTAAVVGDTALGTQLSTRSGLTTSGGTVAGAVITYACTYAAGSHTGAITEAGVFNASSSGTMLCRTVFAVINKGAADTMTVSWAVTIS
jgi:hypothetical protein|tara:strand:+ start:779 stop:1228 length:450 start_codon:yes stop_codon:yes gene_type:complete